MNLHSLAITGIILGLVGVFIASIFKILHWAGSMPLLIIGFGLLMASYGFRFYLKQPKTVLDFSKLAVAIFVPLAYLFSLMYWSYSQWISLASLLAVLAFIVLFVKQKIKNDKAASLDSILGVVAGCGIIGGALLNILHLPYAQYCMIGGMLAMGALVVTTVFKAPTSKKD
ncbi:MAG: hypothetical protein ABJM06_13210 [Gilvibacter sp.]